MYIWVFTAVSLRPEKRFIFKLSFNHLKEQLNLPAGFVQLSDLGRRALKILGRQHSWRLSFPNHGDAPQRYVIPAAALSARLSVRDPHALTSQNRLLF